MLATALESRCAALRVISVHGPARLPRSRNFSITARRPTHPLHNPISDDHGASSSSSSLVPPAESGARSEAGETQQLDYESLTQALTSSTSPDPSSDPVIEPPESFGAPGASGSSSSVSQDLNGLAPLPSRRRFGLTMQRTEQVEDPILQMLNSYKPSKSNRNDDASPTSEKDAAWSESQLDALRLSSISSAPGVTNSPRVFKGVHSKKHRRQGQTPHEAQAFEQVLAEIFEDLERTGPLRAGSHPSNDPYGAQYAVGGNIFRARGLAARRRGAFRYASMELDDQLVEEMDQLKEEMSVNANDADILSWAKRRLFSPEIDDDGYPNFPRSYPHILAHLLRVVRTNFHNPHLALALFQHAQTHSIESYLGGCLTPTYNELLAVRWESFRDLDGVDQAVQEMLVNGVGWDRDTRKLVEKVCEEVAGDLVEPHRARAWGDDALAKLRSLEQKIEQDILREERIYKLKKKPAWEAKSPYQIDDADEEDGKLAAFA